jgi:Fe-S cluster assembly scaffold protein SufB
MNDAIRTQYRSIRPRTLADAAGSAAIPELDVAHSTARVTHEASIGNVDTRQLVTLTTLGPTEDGTAVDTFIQALLSKEPVPRAVQYIPGEVVP